jgi:hypothetical protein
MPVVVVRIFDEPLVTYLRLAENSFGLQSGISIECNNLSSFSIEVQFGIPSKFRSAFQCADSAQHILHSPSVFSFTRAASGERTGVNRGTYAL